MKSEGVKSLITKMRVKGALESAHMTHMSSVAVARAIRATIIPRGTTEKEKIPMVRGKISPK